MTTLLIGTGFVGTAVAAYLREAGMQVTQSSRTSGRADCTIPDGPALDRTLTDGSFDQVVTVGQLTNSDIDWVIERVDGPRWLVLSSHQVTAATPAPESRAAIAREEIALERGACVLRPAMIYGKGKDKNVTRLIRLMQRWHLPLVAGDGDQMVQPLHVDDLSSLIAAHSSAPTSGLFPVGGPESLPMRELVATLAQIIGLRLPVLAMPQRALATGARIGPLLGLRPDQIRRLFEAKTVDIQRTMDTFRWRPEPLGLRLEQAVLEANAA